VRNCVIRGSGPTQTLIGIGSGSTTVGTASRGTGNNSNRIENNDVGACQYGIYTSGLDAVTKNSATVISQNVMTNASPNNIDVAGIHAAYEDALVINANRIDQIIRSGSPDAFGIMTGYATSGMSTSNAGTLEVTNATITNNVIGVVRNNGSFSATGIAVGQAATGTTLVANNVIAGVASGGTVGDFAGGIVVGGGAGTLNVYHNNVVMQGAGPSSSQVSTSFASVSAAEHPLDLKNNVFTNTQTGGTMRYNAMAFRFAAPFTTVLSDNNALFVSSDNETTARSTAQAGGLTAGTRYTFANWQATLALDAASVNVEPGFISPSNARTDGNNANSASLNAAGVTVSASPDIDCVTRSSPPDIGANEFTPATCFSPGGFGVSGITFEEAVLNWTAVGGETYNWEIRTSGVGGDPAPAFSGTAASGPVTVPGLDDVTNYTAFIRTTCPDLSTSVWSNGTAFSTPLAPIQVFPWIEAFEADNGGFAIVNGSQTNKWFHGLANNDVGTPLGGKALYVSNDNGLTNTFSTGSTSTVHTWRDLDLSTPGEYSLQFNYRTVGESTFDYIRVWLAPTSYSPAAGTQTTVSVPGAVRLGGNFNLTDPVIYNNSGVLTIPAAFVGTTARLIFEWRNDGSGGSQPPGSIDSVRVNINPCSAPTNLALSNLFGTSATATWVNGTATVQDYELRTSGAAGSGAAGLELSGTSNTQSLVLTPLLPSTTYTFHIRGNCAPDSSSWISGSFTTPCATGTMPLAEGFNAASTIPACWGQFGVVGTSAATFPTSGTSPTVSPFEGTRFVRWTSFTAGNETRLVAPPLSTVGSANVDVSFAWFENNNASFSAGAFLNEGATLEYSTDGITFTAIQFFARHNGALTVGTGAWAQKLVTVPAGAVGQSTVFFAWRFRSENGNAMALDKVGINTTPVCPVYTVDLVEPIDCSGSTFSIEIDITDLGTDPEVDVVYKVFGTPGDPDTLSVTATGVVTIGPFDRWDLVTVSLLGDNLGPCALDLGRFFSTCPIVIDCDDTTPLTVRHCYTANDPRTFTFVTNDPTRTLDVTFLSGSAIDAADQVDFRAGLPSGGSFSSTPLGTTDLGTLGPLGSTTDSLSLVLLTPSGNSCAAGSPGLGAGWAFTVRCSGCIQPFVQDIIPVPDCSNGTFTLPVEFSYLGFNFATQADADSAGIRYVVNGNAAGADTIWVQNPGVDPFPVDILGPYAFGTTVDITLLHEEGTACDNVLAPITLGYFPNCSNDVVCDAFLTPVNPNFTCTQLRPGQFAGATLTTGVPAATTCGGTLTADVWYRFVATQPSQRIQLQDINTGATNMRTSLYGGDCDGTLTQIGTCVTGTTQLNATGLVPATTYWVRVATVTASSTQTFNICISEPPTLDMQVVTPLVTPLTNGCYTASEPVTVTLRNNTQHTPIDFSVNPVTVTVTLTGASTTVLSTVVNTGTLAASTTQNVVVGNLNMSAAGTYTFAATASVVGDQVPGNNGFTGQTRTVVAPQPIANVALNFDETPGFSGTNLATITSSRWREATGATVPGVGTTSAWNSSATAQNTQLGTGISARIQFTTFTSRNEWLLGPKFVPQVGSVLKYKVAITGSGVGTAATGSGMQAAGAANDRVVVRISTNCGVSYQDLFSHNPSTTVGLTNVWDPRSIDLSAYNGQEVIIAFWANATSVSTHPNYNFLIDDILVLNEPVCAGDPTEGSIATTATLPICAPASATLTVSGQSNEVGEGLSWYSSTTSGGPYTLVPGAVTASLAVSGLTQTTYYVSRNTCLADAAFAESDEFAVTVNPQPVVLTATNDGPVCAGTAVTLGATSDIGTTFAWTGPGSYTSNLQNPSRIVETNQAGTYSVTATLDGCTSAPLTTSVVVTPSPTISSLTATPNPVCVGADAQLQVNATQPGAGGAGSYSFATATGFGLQDMTGASSLVASAVDDGQSSLTSIGFPFSFGGAEFTQFGVSSNGLMRLGSLPGTAATNGFTVTSSILPAWDDLHTGTNGGVSTVLVGSAPNQVRVIEWRVRNFSGESGDFTKTFQVWLYEGTNEIRMVYGVGTDFSPTTTAVGASLGIAGTSSSFQSITTSDHSVSTVTANNGNLPWPGDGRTYLFTPPAPVVLTYLWTPNTYLNNDAIANPLAQSVQGSETYVVTIGAPNGCSRVDTLDLVGGLPLVASISATDTTLCVGQSTILSAVVTGGGTPYTYLWSPGGASVAGITVSPTETTEYTVTVTDNCGINLEVDFTVNVNPLPTVEVTPGTALFCGVDTVDLEASGASTYTWSPAAGLSATTGAAVTATPTATTTYTATGTDANGCVNTATSIITVAPEVSLSFAPELANICLGGSTNLVATAGPTSFNATANSGTISVAIPDGSLTGASSTLALAGGAGSIGANSTVSVTVNITHGWNEDLDIYLVGPGNCGTLELSTDNGGSDDNYTNTVFVTPSAFPSITDGVSPFTGSWTPEGTVNTAADLESGVDGGTYALPASVLAGCPVNGTWTLRVFDDESIFSGTLTNWAIDISGAGGSYTHEITGPGTIGTPVLSGDGNSIATASVSGLPQGENIFTVVSTSSTGCSATTTTTITVGEPLVVTIEPSANPICEGDQVTLTANASGGGEPFEYLWSPGGATTAAITVSPGTTTLYSVTVNDACTNEESANVNVVVNDRPSATATASLACVGGTLQLTGTSDTGTSFAWTGPNAFASTQQSPSISNVTAANAGTYTFTATLGDCSASGTVNVTVNAGASAVTVNPTTINSCFGNTVPLVASGGAGALPATANLGGTSPTTSTTNTPFNRTDENRKTQYLVRALDLQNAGITAGNLTSLSFNVTSGINTPNFMNGYTMKIGTTLAATTSTSAPLTLVAPVTVFGPADYSPVLGSNAFTFDTPFNWNGSSNIVVEICFENDAPGGTCSGCFGNSPTMSMVSASYTGTWNSSADNAPRCAYTGSGSTSTSRPAMTWGYTAQQQPVYTWSPATGLSGTIGASVTATVGSTIQYTVTATLPSGCTNAGTSTINVDPNATTVTLELRSNNMAQASWEIITGTGTPVVVCSGSGYVGSPVLDNCCLAEGCYRLRVFDSGGDGFGSTGGYQLRTLGSNPADIRIIDNLGNFNSGSESSISGGPNAFCFPMGAQKPIFTSREKLDWTTGQYIVAEEDAAVSAQWLQGVSQTDDGYEFWFFDPNGGYAFRRFRNHATSDGFGNVGATRACHMKINNWSAASHIPANRLMNVRIRSRVNGLNGPWGPAYRFKIDPALAACPLTKLNNIPGNQFESCNKSRLWGSGWIHALPVTGANRYQFRFRLPAEGYAQVITSNTYFLQLNWTAVPGLTPGKTYQVDVRISKNGGTTWCQIPGQWGGDVCTLEILDPNDMQGGGQELAVEGNNANLLMWPNPNNGDQLWLSLDAIEENVETVSVDIFDLAGKRAMARIIPTQGGHLNTVLDVNGELGAGVYIVTITAGDKVYTERLVIAK
jgi:subtilisin-like proprotein convertase family protein